LWSLLAKRFKSEKAGRPKTGDCREEGVVLRNGHGAKPIICRRTQPSAYFANE
jgi:hypothetical protein